MKNLLIPRKAVSFRIQLKVSWLREYGLAHLPVLHKTEQWPGIRPRAALNPSQLRDSGRFSLRFPCKLNRMNLMIINIGDI